jgi:hypothetical protein
MTVAQALMPAAPTLLPAQASEARLGRAWRAEERGSSRVRAQARPPNAARPHVGQASTPAAGLESCPTEVKP